MTSKSDTVKDGIVKKGRRLFVPTRNRANPFRSSTRQLKGKMNVEMDPGRSKLGAGVSLGFTNVPSSDDFVLYLGASAGYTVSFIAHFTKIVFAVEVSPIMCRDLILNTTDYDNIAPILADAHNPLGYAHRLCTVDYVFQDISQRDQLDIFERNVDMFLKKGGIGVIAIKARSIDSTKEPDDIFKKSADYLSTKYDVLEQVNIGSFEKDHMLIVIRK